MTTEAFITELFYQVDEMLLNVKKHPQTKLDPIEVVGSVADWMPVLSYWSVA